MKLLHLNFLAAAAASLLLASGAQAVLVTSGSGTIESTDPLQTNRIFRDGVESTWAAPKSYPGNFGTSNTFHYDLVAIAFAPNALQDIFYEISYVNLDVVSPHLTAYADSFDPSDLAANYLGDTGSTSLASPPGETMQVMVTAGSSLLLHFSGVNDSVARYEYEVLAFSDANRNENFLNPVPEPASLALVGLALAAVGLSRRKAA